MARDRLVMFAVHATDAPAVDKAIGRRMAYREMPDGNWLQIWDFRVAAQRHGLVEAMKLATELLSEGDAERVRKRYREAWHAARTTGTR